MPASSLFQAFPPSDFKDLEFYLTEEILIPARLLISIIHLLAGFLFTVYQTGAIFT